MGGPCCGEICWFLYGSNVLWSKKLVSDRVQTNLQKIISEKMKKKNKEEDWWLLDQPLCATLSPLLKQGFPMSTKIFPIFSFRHNKNLVGQKVVILVVLATLVSQWHRVTM
jgi:hypothetical protein